MKETVRKLLRPLRMGMKLRIQIAKKSLEMKQKQRET